MIFVDSSVWIDYINGKESAQVNFLDGILGYDGIVIGDLVIAEVLQGCTDARTFAETKRLLGLAGFIVVSDYAVAVQAAQNYMTLRAKGITVRKTIDTLIATRCLVNDLTLLHNDRDFLPFEEHLGLRSAI
jgi:predicted nucleic acid-binding protein